MDNFLQHMAQRRSVKPFEMNGSGPDEQQLSQILTLASRVPDHGKLVPWRFIVLEGDARVRAGRALEQVWLRLHPDAADARLASERNRFVSAPTVVIVVSTAASHVKIPVWEQQLSAGAVCMALTIAASAMGFRTAWLTDWCAYDADAKAVLGVSGAEKIAGIIHVGQSDSVPVDRPRPDISHIVTRY